MPQRYIRRGTYPVVSMPRRSMAEATQLPLAIAGLGSEIADLGNQIVENKRHTELLKLNREATIELQTLSPEIETGNLTIDEAREKTEEIKSKYLERIDDPILAKRFEDSFIGTSTTILARATRLGAINTRKDRRLQLGLELDHLLDDFENAEIPEEQQAIAEQADLLINQAVEDGILPPGKARQLKDTTQAGFKSRKMWQRIRIDPEGVYEDLKTGKYKGIWDEAEIQEWMTEAKNQIKEDDAVEESERAEEERKRDQLREAANDNILSVLITNPADISADDILDNPVLTPSEKLSWIKIRTELLKPKDSPYKTTDEGIKGSILHRIEFDPTLTISDIYDLMGKGLSVSDTKMLADRFRTRKGIGSDYFKQGANILQTAWKAGFYGRYESKKAFLNYNLALNEYEALSRQEELAGEAFTKLATAMVDKQKDRMVKRVLAMISHWRWEEREWRKRAIDYLRKKGYPTTEENIHKTINWLKSRE